MIATPVITRGLTALTALVAAAGVAAGAAGAQPPFSDPNLDHSGREVRQCTGSGKEQVCIRLWDEFGVVKAQPSGGWKFYTLDITDGSGRTQRETAARDYLRDGIRVVDLGRGGRFTVTAQGHTDSYIPGKGKDSGKVTAVWS